MIIDRQKSLRHAQQAGIYDVCDAATHKPLGPEYGRIWYADDEAGVIRRYIDGENGETPKALRSVPHLPLTDEQLEDHYIVKDGITYWNPQLCLAWVEERVPIRIIRKADVV